MKLVKFEDGSYGVRAYWFFGWRFRDLISPEFTHQRGSCFFRDCKGTKEQAVRQLNTYVVMKSDD